MIHNKIKNILIPCLLLFSMFFTGCSNNKKEHVSMEDIIANLESNGYKVEVMDDLTHSIFPMSSKKYLKINDSKEVNIDVYTFDSVEIAKQQAQTISKDGHKAGNSYISWASPQAFFAKDNLIVRCDKISRITKHLEKLLSKPITE